MTSASMDWPGRRVLLQRVRNRLIEYLEVASSFKEQQAYQAQAPELDVPNEVIHQWEDWVSADWESELIEPVFSSDERHAIARFQTAWADVKSRTPEPLPALNVMIERTEWQQLSDAANALLAVFNKRGKLSESIEVN